MASEELKSAETSMIVAGEEGAQTSAEPRHAAASKEVVSKVDVINIEDTSSGDSDMGLDVGSEAESSSSSTPEYLTEPLVQTYVDEAGHPRFRRLKRRRIISEKDLSEGRQHCDWSGWWMPVASGFSNGSKCLRR